MSQRAYTRTRRLAAGFCIDCGTHPHQPNRQRCRGCAVANSHRTQVNAREALVAKRTARIMAARADRLAPFTVEVR